MGTITTFVSAYRRAQAEREAKEGPAVPKKPSAWPFWKTMMFFVLPFGTYRLFQANVIAGVFGGVILFLLAAMLKVHHDDKILKAQNPDYVTTVEIAKPLILIWAIVKFPAIVIFLIAAVWAAKDVWF